MEMSADFSPCGIYRYRLTRIWGNGPNLNVIGLNPSTADEKQDDPTIRRCIQFARDWDYGGLVMTNLLAYRATDPKVLAKLEDSCDAIGPDNWDWVVREAKEAGRVVAAWGANSMGVWAESHAILRFPYDQKIWCLGLTKGGHPKHPLYLRRDTVPIIYRDRATLDSESTED